MYRQPRDSVAVIAGCVLEVGDDLATESGEDLTLRYMHRCCCCSSASSAFPIACYTVGRQPRDLVVGFSGKSSKGRWISRISLARIGDKVRVHHLRFAAPPLMQHPSTSSDLRVFSGDATI